MRRKVAELEEALRAGSDGPRSSRLADPEETGMPDLLEGISDSVAALDSDWRYTYVNKCAEAMARRSTDELIGRVFWDVFPELKATASFEHFHRTMRERVHTRFEELYAPYDLWVEVDAHPAANEIVMFVRDITARKTTERRLSESEERARKEFAELEHYYQTAPVGLAFVDCQLRYQRINQRLAAINGLSIEQHLGRTIREIRPEVADAVAPYLLEVIRTKQPILDREIPAKQRFYRSSYYPVESDSRIIGVSVVVQDITLQKEVELALRESEERLQLAVEARQIGIFDWDINTGRVVLSDQEYELFGLRRDQFDGSIRAWLEHVLPEDLDRINAAFRECLSATNQTLAVEFRIRRPDQELLWIQSHERILYNQERLAYRVVGVHFDITDERLAEEELRRSEERYRALFENTRDGILIVDEGGQYGM